MKGITMKKLLTVLLGTLLFTGSSAAQVVALCVLTLECAADRGAEDRTAVQPAQESQKHHDEGTQYCGLAAFSENPAEHIIVELSEPFRVLAIEGTMASEVGGWPDHVRPRFEMRLPKRSAEVLEATVDVDGRFSIPDVSRGTYCFKASAIGWQSVLGTVEVTPDADRNATITIRMPLGV